jgi:hypothetical protein
MSSRVLKEKGCGEVLAELGSEYSRLIIWVLDRNSNQHVPLM